MYRRTACMQRPRCCLLQCLVLWAALRCACLLPVPSCHHAMFEQLCRCLSARPPARLQVLCASNEAHDAVDPVNPPEGAAVGERITFAG